ncbi:exodeoxyribonuclease III [Candidatus Saccharibacteria bacterium]|nr:exodeoxyribonuclease III [Candidatus Saccharibacteria bacterium]
MKLYSWNINGLRAVLKRQDLQKMLESENPDVLCLQEIKAKPDQIDFEFAGYNAYWNPAKRLGYSGTMILVKKGLKAKPIISALKSSDNSDDTLCKLLEEGRIIALEFDQFFLVNVYTPNSKPDLSRLKTRELLWDPAFLNYLKELEKEKPVITCGDFNAAHEEIDIARPKTNHHSAGFTDEERQGITNIISKGFIDTFRALHPKDIRYTWWSHWGHARENNVGWRIDYFFISSELSSALNKAEIYEQIQGSDHCPISIEMDF